jgi:ATPase subunit of ABC transporter with duplicated ATPase domains
LILRRPFCVRIGKERVMALVSLQDVSLGFGGPLLLEEANLQIEQGEAVRLLGRNGRRKTSLLKLIYGELLGCALVREPDLQLLDEPTNHLDIQAITCLEDFLARAGQARCCS